MTSQSETSFYKSELDSDRFDYTVVDDPEPLRLERATKNSSVVQRVVGMAASGMLVFGPCGISMSADALSTVDDVVIVRMHAPSDVEHIPISASHRDAATRFQKLFRAVPVSDVEQLPDPDYGL